jgi:hypothetical protein
MHVFPEIMLLIFVLNKLAMRGEDACGSIITRVFLPILFGVIVILLSN